MIFVLLSLLFLNYFTAHEYFHQKGEGRGQLKCNPLTMFKELMKSWDEYHKVDEFLLFCVIFLLTEFPFFLLLSSPIYNSWCRDEWTLCHDNLEYKCCFSPLFLSSQVCTGAGAARDWKTPSWFLDLLEEDLTEQSGCWWLPVRLTHSPIPTGRKPPIS